MSIPVVIIGAGLAGMACARVLREQGIEVLVLERDESIGGRVKTDSFEGFQLDRGFQVFLPAYPEAKRILDYDSLDLRPFYPGALIRSGGRFHRLGDPWQRPFDAIVGALSPIGTLGDKLRVGRLRLRLARTTLEEIHRRPETTTLRALRQEGFSEAMIEQFFRPFLGGVFLEHELNTTSRKFEFVFKMFAKGGTAVPASGMAAIPKQLASSIGSQFIRTGCRVKALNQGSVVLDSGEEVRAQAIVVATDGDEAWRLCGRRQVTAWNASTCLYFAAEQPPLDKPVLVLDGERSGPVNNLVVLDQVASTYAPRGRSLVSVTVLGVTQASDEDLVDAVRSQLETWFGRQVRAWELLRICRITKALPTQLPGAATQNTRLRPGLYACGDHLDTASIQGAFLSGRRAAESVIADL